MAHDDTGGGARARTYVFVDLAGFSALTEAHGDHVAADCAERLEARVRDALGPGDRLVSAGGDAAFVTAPDPDAGLAFVSRLLVGLDGEADFPGVRIGLHHGEATTRGTQLYGAAVNLAARVAGHARGGEVLGTLPIAEAAGRQGLRVDPLGPVTLRNLRAAVELFGIAVGSASDASAVDPVCRMRVLPARAAATLVVGGRRWWFCSAGCLRAFVPPSDPPPPAG